MSQQLFAFKHWHNFVNKYTQWSLKRKEKQHEAQRLLFCAEDKNLDGLPKEVTSPGCIIKRVKQEYARVMRIFILGKSLQSSSTEAIAEAAVVRG